MPNKSQVGFADYVLYDDSHKPLGEFVREIVGLDMNAAKEAFSQFLDDASMDSRQIYFVNQVVELFSADLNVWNGIRETIDRINANAMA